MTPTIASSIHQFNCRWMIAAVSVIVLILCFQFLLGRSFIDSALRSNWIWPNYHILSFTKALLNKTDHKSDENEAGQNLFPSGNFTSDDDIRNRTLAQLKMMTIYGTKSLTVNRKLKVMISSPLKLSDFVD
jgi:hypothetical protein